MTVIGETPGVETHKFQAEVNQLLKLVINSLYSHKEIFIRELISNASDALDKLKFRAMLDPDLLRDEPDLEIRVIPDRTAGTITIEDTGIGMTHDELVQDLGTIAHSGSRAFLEQLAERAQEDLNLIGQFGVGFYSAYLVAERVDVISRAAGSDAAYRWSSEAKDSFTIERVERGARGTSVVLHLKDDQKELLDEWKLRELITRYSDYVNHPIKLRVETPDPSERDSASGSDGERDRVGGSSAEAFVTVNRAAALWQRPKGEITEEQYADFYKHLTHEGEALARTHFRVEGSREFVGLLFIPKLPPYDLNSTVRRGIRLFVKRVFIMDNCEELLPQWLRFVRGVVDSDDLPLNVSRELLQDSAVVRAIRKQVVKRTLDLLEELAKDRPEDYIRFWESFGAVLKEGLTIDYEYRDRLAELVRYESSAGAGLTALADYVKRMPEGQPAIYYITGESLKALAASPHSETLRKRGYEVLFMTDPVDEWATDSLREYGGQPLVSAMRADLKLNDTDEEKKEKEQRSGTVKPLIDRMREILGDRVREVRTSDRLTDSPCCLVVPEGATSAYLERLLHEHGRDVPGAKRILEVNPGHPLIGNLLRLVERGDDARVTEWVEMMYDQALLTEGSRIPDPNLFARRLTDLLERVTSEGTTTASTGVPAA